MAWLRIDDGFAQHPKLEGWSPKDKWTLIELFLYCAKHRTDGYVPEDLSLLPRAVTHGFLAKATHAGFLDRDADGALVVHDWAKYNPSDPTAADRMQRLRARRNAERNGTRNKGVTTWVTDS